VNLQPDNRSDIQVLTDRLARGYHDIADILGAPNSLSIAPLCDPIFGKPDSQTITGFDIHSDGAGATWNWRDTNGATAATWPEFDAHNAVADDKRFPYKLQGVVPYIELNGSDECVDAADAAYWTFSGGALTFAFWFNLADTTSVILFSKWDETTSSQDREFKLATDSSSRISFQIYDEGNAAYIGRRNNSAIASGVWSHCLVTFDGGTAAGGVKIYIDNTQIDTNDSTGGSGFANVVDGATVVRLGAFMNSGGNVGGFTNGKFAGSFLGLTSWAAQPTAAQRTNLFNYGKAALGLI
jgi:hypothetical protein